MLKMIACFWVGVICVSNLNNSDLYLYNVMSRVENGHLYFYNIMGKVDDSHLCLCNIESVCVTCVDLQDHVLVTKMYWQLA
jgi:hypothetical protein